MGPLVQRQALAEEFEPVAESAELVVAVAELVRPGVVAEQV